MMDIKGTTAPKPMKTALLAKLRDLVLGQVKINENISKKLLANDKTLESLNVNLETLSSTLKNQLSFNKVIETQLAQIAASLPTVESGKIPGQP